MDSVPGPGRSHLLWNNKAYLPPRLSPHSKAPSRTYWAYVLQMLKPTPQSPCSTARQATPLRRPHRALESSLCSPPLDKASSQQLRPSAIKNKEFFKRSQEVSISLVGISPPLKRLISVPLPVGLALH